MLTHADNETLVRVGPGTEMGNLIRRYWIPALLCSELPEKDGTPVRIRLLGEDLVAFRNTDGEIGLLQENCPHRRASLALGVNDKGGLRCLYHGWKFDVNGNCIEAPTEPDDAKICKNVKAVSYPAREAGSVVWVYMGPKEEEPDFPHYEWFDLPAANAVPFKLLEDCNYAQAVEGTIDTAHAGALHRVVHWDSPGKFDHENDLDPLVEVEMTEYGMRYAGLRDLEGKTHVRLTQVVLPFMTMIPEIGRDAPPSIAHRRLVNTFVPRDDESTWHIQWFFDPTREIDIAHRIEEGGIWVDENFRKLVNINNWYNQDRQWMKQADGMMSGIKGIVTQDHAVCETMGKISDRTKEHLGQSDKCVVAWRRQMIRAARALDKDGVAPPGSKGCLNVGEVKAAQGMIPKGERWQDHFVKAELN